MLKLPIMPAKKLFGKFKYKILHFVGNGHLDF